MLDEQRFLRQQLAMAGVHADCLKTASDELPRRAFLQASLSSLDVGLRYYLAKLLGLPNLRRISEIHAAAVASPTHFKQEELLSLLGDASSWLRDFAVLVDSFVEKEPLVLEGAPGGVSREGLSASQGIIARTVDLSAPSTLCPHWTTLSLSQLEGFFAHVHELLVRHSEQDIEN